MVEGSGLENRRAKASWVRIPPSPPEVPVATPPGMTDDDGLDWLLEDPMRQGIDLILRATGLGDEFEESRSVGRGSLAGDGPGVAVRGSGQLLPLEPRR